MSKENINLPKTQFSMKANLPNKEPEKYYGKNKLGLALMHKRDRIMLKETGKDPQTCPLKYRIDTTDLEHTGLFDVDKLV